MIKTLLKNTILLFLFSILKIYAQEATISIEKTTFKLDEEIQVDFIVNQEYDSISQVDLNDFIILEKPKKSQTSSVINNKSKYEYKISYKLLPKSFGQFTLNSPVYYSKNNEISAEKITITILDERLTEEENKTIDFKKTAKRIFKPEGTLRYVIINNEGYIEEFRNKDWKFIRILTKKEIKRIKK